MHIWGLNGFTLAYGPVLGQIADNFGIEKSTKGQAKRHSAMRLTVPKTLFITAKKT